MSFCCSSKEFEKFQNKILNTQRVTKSDPETLLKK